ncbi:ASCH domain-containing protein [Stutzerimonas nitrititolerans]|uniref:ASCH domain-containing protein n=1 Tax=Stutzerimonas nitrititolerans TaxID=2482751 RepID=UPI0028AE958E|nr:ASCH domain-containing protein [Stutzerimonas nitrititolerans]
MKALSIRQPWAWLIVNGYKDIENRSWATRYRGPVLIHAAKGMTRAEYEDGQELARHLGITLPAFNELERGGIVGQAEITDCVSDSSSPWFFGKFGFVLANASPCAFQSCVGRLGFFKPDLEPQREELAPNTSPSTPRPAIEAPAMKTMTLDEFRDALKAQGVPRDHFAFRCPRCKTIQSANDLIAAGAGEDFEAVERYLGFSCVGRFTGADDPSKTKPGCNWTLGGLFQIHELEVVTEDGIHHPRFSPATPDEAQAHQAASA